MACNDADDFLPPAKRFRKPLSVEEEDETREKAVPKATLYKNRWAVSIFNQWRESRVNKKVSLEPTSSTFDIQEFENLDIEYWEEMNAKSLNFWVAKFVQEVQNKKGERYPAKTLYQLVAALKRHLESKDRTDVNMLDKSNGRYYFYLFYKNIYRDKTPVAVSCYSRALHTIISIFYIYIQF